MDYSGAGHHGQEVDVGDARVRGPVSAPASVPERLTKRRRSLVTAALASVDTTELRRRAFERTAAAIGDATDSRST